MSGRLIKYDLLALGRTLLPLQAGIFGICLFFAAYLTWRVRTDSSLFSGYGTGESPIDNLLDGLLGFGIMLLGAIIMAGFFITLFLVARHFYLNVYSDEGYLTMTLPATIGQHIISKTVSGFIWLMIDGLVMLLGMGIILFCGFATEGLLNHEILQFVADILRTIADYSPLLFVVYPITAILGVLSSLMCVYACLAAGCAWAKKHRIALAILLIFAVYVVTSTIGSVADVVVALSTGPGSVSSFLEMSDPDQLYRYYLAVSTVRLVIDAVLIFAYGAFMHYALSNRLNLE
ncbi:MAG: hypothetical protein LBO07_06550 [Coriobacteriales bacterium]|jgi:hypothetical protein|nr:hypothetical protein [Coriobacteriales bacterium]